MTDTTPVIVRTRGHIGRLTLNRPKALNALDLDMIRLMTKALMTWRADDAIVGVVVDGAGEKAFCAGGDIRALVDGRHGAQYAHRFYAEEYRLNTLIKEYPKPYVAMIDGIVMGGGVGVSVHGAHRIAGDRTLFAMPETGIGFYPDVGGSYFLPRLEGELGTWLALTGARLKAADLMALGIATAYAPSEQHTDIIAALEEEVCRPSHVRAVINSLTGRPGPAPVRVHKRLINTAFAGDRVEDILARLAEDGSEWANEQAKIIATKSPTSLKVTRRQMREGKVRDFRACMAMELGLSLKFVRGKDFSEGVRALLIDRDNAPRWQPARLADVSAADVAAFFTPLPEPERLTFLPDIPDKET